MRAIFLNSFLFATAALISSNSIGSPLVENEPLYVHVKYEDGLEFEARRCGNKVCQFLVAIKKGKIDISALDDGELDGVVLSTVSLFYDPRNVSIHSFLIKASVWCDMYPIFEAETGPIECFADFEFVDGKLAEVSFLVGKINYNKKIQTTKK